MLSVGVHENVQFSKVAKNDKGTLIVGFKKQEVDKLAALSQGRFEPEEQDFLIFPPQLTNYSGSDSTPEEMLVKWGEITSPLEHIATQFLTKDKVKWDLFFGTGITKENYDAKMTQQDTVDKIYNNIVTQFINWMMPFTKSTKTFRMVFIRSSKAKHYAKLRTRYLSSQPFMEPMDVTPSKVKFSEYEKKNGLDNPNQAGGAQAPSTADTNQAEEMFAGTSIES
jgi:hypothetical protein